MTTHILHSAHTCVQGKHLCLCCLWASVWAAELGASDGDSPGEMALMQMMPLDITQMLANFTNDATKHLSDANFTLTRVVSEFDILCTSSTHLIITTDNRVQVQPFFQELVRPVSSYMKLVRPVSSHMKLSKFLFRSHSFKLLFAPQRIDKCGKEIIFSHRI